MKRALSSLLACAMLLALASCGGTSSSSGSANSASSGSGEAELTEMNLIMASSASSTNESYGIQVAAAEAASEKTGGKLTIDCIWDGTLGSDSELIENCLAGSIPMISLASSPLLSYIPEIAVFDMPAVFSDAETAYEGISKFEEVFAPIMESVGFKLLGMGFYQFRGLSTNTNLQTPADFEGMSIRTMENKYHMAFWENMGCAPTPLAFSELYISLQQGLVDAQDNPFSAVYSSKFYEVQKYFMPVTVFPFVNFRLMNLEQYNALPEEYQQALVEFAQEDLYNEYEHAEVEDANAAEKMGDAITILTQTDEIFQAMQDAAKPVWDMIRADIGDEMCDAYLEAAGIEA